MQLTKINYQTENEAIQVVALEEHAWVTISDMTQILNITQPAVSQHIATLEKLNQLEEGKHIITLPITRIEGEREITRQIKHYSELAVIRIGFRVNGTYGTRVPRVGSRDTANPQARRCIYPHSAKDGMGLRNNAQPPQCHEVPDSSHRAAH